MPSFVKWDSNGYYPQRSDGQKGICGVMQILPRTLIGTQGESLKLIQSQEGGLKTKVDFIVDHGGNREPLEFIE